MYRKADRGWAPHQLTRTHLRASFSIRHGNDDVAPRTLNSILKQAGLGEKP
jgi:predicted RNA binding protein YcfA (HicA-like mRNA interferase family)